MSTFSSCNLFFFFNDTATTEIYTLSLHDALPIWELYGGTEAQAATIITGVEWMQDRKSTRLNSSHANISYAVFCLKKKKTKLNSNCLMKKKKKKMTKNTNQAQL